MAQNSGTDEVQARELEAEEARAQLARTLEKLTSPETQEAMKAEVLGHVQSYKDELLKQADRYKDELLEKVDEYKSELLTRAESYKGEIMERADQYKGEFLTRADEYKNEALERAEAYKDEALQRARDAGRETVHNVVEDLQTRAMNNPVAVALIGAGIGWRLYKHPPITTLLVGAGAAMLMKTPGRSAKVDRTAYRDPYRETQPRGYVPGGVAGYGYPVEENAPGSSTTEQMMAMASNLGEKARGAGTSVREAASEAGAVVSDAAERARSMATSAAGDAFDTAGGLVRTVRQKPLLLALVSLAAGVVVARSVRATETGNRLVQGGTGMIGRGARDVTSRIGGAASQVVEGLNSAVSTVGDVAGAVGTGVPELASDLTEAAGRAAASVAGLASRETSEAPERPRASPNRSKGRKHLSSRRDERHRQRGTGQSASREIVQMIERYPLLLGSLGLVIGAAAGAVLRPTATEDRYVGRASDALKRRAQGGVANQLEQVVAAADEMIASVENKRDMPTGGDPMEESDAMNPGSMQADKPGTAARDDIDKTSVVVERAEDAAATRTALGGTDPVR